LDNGSEPLNMEWFSKSREYDDVQDKLKKMEAFPCQTEIKQYMDLVKRARSLTAEMFSARSNGYLYCQKFIMNTYEKYIDIVKLIVFDDNYKDQLQTYFQKKHDMFPTWKVIKEEGKTNQRWHTIGVHDRCGFLIGTGRDRKKTDAEQTASRNALIYLGVISEDYGNDFFR
jgi:hypothetical protein